MPDTKYDLINKETGIMNEKQKQLENEKGGPYEVVIRNESFVVFPGVFSPAIYDSTEWFSEVVPHMVENDKVFLEMGCGCGAVSIMVAKHNRNIKIIAADINKFAIENTKKNIERHNLIDRMKAYESNVFDGLNDKDLLFDSIFWAMPFGYTKPEDMKEIYDSNVHDAGYEAIGRFIKQANMFLAPNGKLLIGFSQDIGNYDKLQDLCKNNNIELKLLMERKVKEISDVRMQIFEGKIKN